MLPKPTLIAINNRDVAFGIEGDKPFVISRDLAAVFGKRHADVMRAIEALPQDEYHRRNFASISYQDSYGRNQKAYHIARDGFALLAMGFTGEKAYQWKVAFIDGFNQMEARLRANVALPAEVAEALKHIPQMIDALNQSTAAIKEKDSIIKQQSVAIRQQESYIAGIKPLVKPPMYNKMLNKSEYEKARQLALEGKTIAQSARIMGRSKDTLRKIAKQRGFVFGAQPPQFSGFAVRPISAPKRSFAQKVKSLLTNAL
jgi:Rha family phage regulatory protein